VFRTDFGSAIQADTVPERSAADAVHPEKKCLSAQEVVKAYAGREVVSHVSVSTNRGEVVALLGPNGAGKTTTFYMLAGLVRPDSGRIMLDDEDITHLPMYRRARKGISYLPQEPSVFRKLTVRQNLLAVLETLPISAEEREARLHSLLQELGIEHLANVKAAVLSGGERRRVEIARALVLDPLFLCLDEPFAGIDPITVIEIKRLITYLKGRGIGVLLSDHNVHETLSIINRAYVIHRGKILIEGTPEEVVDSREVREVFLGQEFRLRY